MLFLLFLLFSFSFLVALVRTVIFFARFDVGVHDNGFSIAMSFRMLRAVRHRVKARYELARARMQLRNLMDYELIGRYCGLLLFPFLIYVCVGQMQGYTDDQIRNRLAARRQER